MLSACCLYCLLERFTAVYIHVCIICKERKKANLFVWLVGRISRLINNNSNAL